MTAPKIASDVKLQVAGGVGDAVVMGISLMKNTNSVHITRPRVNALVGLTYKENRKRMGGVSPRKGDSLPST